MLPWHEEAGLSLKHISSRLAAGQQVIGYMNHERPACRLFDSSATSMEVINLLDEFGR